MAHSHLSIVICHLLFDFVLFLSYLSTWCVYGAKEAVNRHHVAEMRSLAHASTASTSTEGPAWQYKGLQMAHRRGTRLPLGHKKSPSNSRLLLLQDELRVRSLNSMKTDMYTTDEFGLDINLLLHSAAGGNFVVTLGFGTPKRDFNLLFDTGSDISWIQCQPCSVGCLDPTFDPSLSSTFSNATCNSSSCDYTINYHDGSYTIGYLANDTITVSSTDVYDGFVFGCAQNISGDFGGAAGVLGIGQGMYSFMAQTDKTFLSLFCYCLPATENSTGYVVFGIQAFDTCQPVPEKMISLIVNPNLDGLTTYFVNLVGLTIGQQRLDISSYVSSSLNTIIDSGTVITRLPPAVYAALRSAFRELMSKYPVASPWPPLDTCYNLEGYKTWTPPLMVLHFENSVDVKLDQSAVTLRGSDDSQVCLAFSGNNETSDLTIIGNQQHRALNVFYDIKNGKLAFGTGDCTN